MERVDLVREILKFPMGRPLTGADVLWRVQACRCSICVNPELEFYGVSQSHLEAWWYRVSKRTRCGAWIDGGGKFVNLQARKQWACNTVDEALASFIARKRRQVSILSAQLKAAEADLSLALKEQQACLTKKTEQPGSS